MLKLKNIARPVDAFVLIFDVASSNLTRVRRLVSGFLPVQQFRRLGAFLAATAPAAIAAAVLSFGNLNFYPSLYKEAVRAEAHHAEEMVRLQALNATQASLVHERKFWSQPWMSGRPAVDERVHLAKSAETVHDLRPARCERIYPSSPSGSVGRQHRPASHRSACPLITRTLASPPRNDAGGALSLAGSPS